MTRERLARFLVPIAAVLVVVALTLLLLYNEPLRKAILEPITWAIHDIRSGLAALPQALLWGIGLLLGCTVILVTWRRAFRGSKKRPPRARGVTVAPHNTSAVASLARDLRRAPKRHVSRSRVVRELSILAVRLIAKREGVSLEQARKTLQSGRWPDDPEIRRFFAARRDGETAVPKTHFIEAAEATLAFLDSFHQEV